MATRKRKHPRWPLRGSFAYPKKGLASNSLDNYGLITTPIAPRIALKGLMEKVNCTRHYNYWLKLWKQNNT